MGPNDSAATVVGRPAKKARADRFHSLYDSPSLPWKRGSPSLSSSLLFIVVSVSLKHVGEHELEELVIEEQVLRVSEEEQVKEIQHKEKDLPQIEHPALSLQP